MPKDIDPISEGLQLSFISPNELDRNGEPANVVDGLFAIAESLNNVAAAIDRLGINRASTGMGAMEVLSLELKNGLEGIAAALATE